MSQLKLKQIAGPADNKSGSVIVFEGTAPKWSTDLATALQLPAGATASRPQDATNGAIRYNSTTHKVEAYENGNWTALSGPSDFISLSDSPGAYTEQAGKAIRVNSTATGLEYFVPPTGLSKFRFKVVFGAQNPQSTDELPSGWSVTINTNDLIVTHNLGTTPAFVSTFAVSSFDPTHYIHRISGAGGGSSISLRYPLSGNANTCIIGGVSVFSTGAAQSSHAYVEMYFLLT